MLNALSGRVNRRTYVIGNIIALGVLFLLCALIMIPLAILSLVLHNKLFDEGVSVIVKILILPILLWLFYFVILMIRRLHDINFPGLIIVVAFFAFMGFGRLMDLWLLNLAGVFVILAICLIPGKKHRNQFGPHPRKRVNFEDLKVNF